MALGLRDSLFPSIAIDEYGTYSSAQGPNIRVAAQGLSEVQYELVLNFHGVGVPHPRVGPDERAVWVSREDFIACLDHVAEWRDIYKMPIRITFDDGNASDVTIALPELCKRNLRASFFVCAGRFDSPDYLDRSAVRELLGAGMQIGSHGMHHRDWRTLDEGGLVEEVETARKCLEDVCGSGVTTAAVPFGSYDRRVLARLRAEGFTCVYTSDRGLTHSDAWLKPRNTLCENTGQDELLRLLRKGPGLKSALRSTYQLYKRLR